MKSIRHPFIALSSLGFTCVFAAVSRAASLYTFGHGDIRVIASGSQLSLGYHIGAPESDYAIVGGEHVYGRNYAPPEIHVNVPLDLVRTLPSDFPALGGSQGESVWILPSHDVYPVVAPFLGFSTEGFDGAEWGTFRFTLGEVRSPSGTGEFAVWSGLSGGGISTLLSTVDGVGQGYFDITGKGHIHHTLGFTEPGLWEIELTVMGTYLPDGTPSTATDTYYFNVVPEPSSALLALAGAICVMMGRRRS